MTDYGQTPTTRQPGRPLVDPPQYWPSPDHRPTSPYGPPQAWTGSFAAGPTFPTPPPDSSPTPPPRRKRGRLWLALLAAVTVGIITYALVDGRDASAPERAPGTEVAEPTALSPIDLQPGDCYNAAPLPADGTDTPISSVDAVPCTDPHTAQVVTKLGYAGQDHTDVVETRAPADCARETQALLRPELLADPAYTFGQIYPTSLSWPRTPTVACIVVTEAPTTGSALI